MSVPVYSLLNDEKREIRFLKLEQGELADQPRCTLHVVSMEDDLDFCALSYVWGSTEERKVILLGDDALSVTPNLEEALRYLQCVKNIIYMWIDAICINQMDAIEKQHQIGLLTDVYSRARLTYMWVGPPVYYSNIAMELLRNMKSTHERFLSNAQIFSLLQLVERPYWNRIWVIQEVFYSHRAIIKCGHDEAEFTCVYDMVKLIEQRNLRPRTDRCPANPAQNILRFSKPFPFRLLLKLCPKDAPKGVPINVDLFRWLNYTDKFAATLARDHIFALLNLSFVTDKRFIKPDYRTTTLDRRIFAEATAYMVRSRPPTKNLLPLQLRQVGKMLDLSSWTPDWTIHAHDAPIVPKPHDPEYCAGQSKDVWKRLAPNSVPLGQNTGGRPVNFTFSEDFETLIIRGLRIDRIAFAVSVADGNHLARQPKFRTKARMTGQRQVLDAYRKWEAKAVSYRRNAYQSVEGLTDAMWRTMMGNGCGNEKFANPPSAEYGICFERWKELVAEGRNDVDDPAVNDEVLVDLDYRITTFDELRAYCCTENGYVGLVHPSTQEGDVIFIFEDGRISFVLRERDDCWTWLGEAYIHGVMYGEAMTRALPEDLMVLKVR